MLAHGEVHDPHMLCKQIDQHVVFLQKELAFILETQRESIKGVTEKTWGLDLLEIYCGESSEITRQSQNLGLRAKRFTVSHGDLSTADGRRLLWSWILRDRPREIWVAPECGP